MERQKGMKYQKSNTRSIVLVGMFTAILAALSQVSIPLPTGVPVTLQTLGFALAGYFLGWKFGCVSTFIYILSGTVGVPVFANFKGGLQVLVGTTGGFIFGFFFLVICCGLTKKMKNKMGIICLSILGLFICHLLGVLQFMIISERTFLQSFLMVSMPYLIKDIILVLLAYLCKKTLAHHYRIIAE